MRRLSRLSIGFQDWRLRRLLRRPPLRGAWLALHLAAITFVFGGICFWLFFYVCGFDLAQGLKQASKTCAQSGAATGLVGAIAAWAATIGWITQRFTAASLACKQHTLNILIGMRNSELYNTHQHLDPATNVPWHRVVNAKGEVSFSLSRNGGDILQRRLLEKEGIKFDAGNRMDLERSRWRD